MERILTIVKTSGLPLETRVGLEDWLAGSGIKIKEIQQLDCAVEVLFSGEIDGPEIAAWAETRKVDLAVQKAGSRLKKLLVCDMESTLVENEFLDELAAFCGVGEVVKTITARAMNGEIDFAESLRERLRLLVGQPVGLLDRAYEGLHLMAGANELFAGLKAHGVRTVIVSGGFKFFTSRVAAILGVDEDFANDLEIVNGELTGEPLGAIVGREEKKRILETTALTMGIPLEETASIGDGANDLPMLLTSGLGVAFQAKPSVDAAAPYRIRHSDLRGLLYFMGIGR